MGLPKSASNKTSWAISAQPTIKHRITNTCDKFILRTIQLNKRIISNRIEFISCKIKNGGISERNIPFIVERWDRLNHLMKNLYKWDFHLHYEYPIRLPTCSFDFDSGNKARDSRNPNGCFQQLIIDQRGDRQETIIYTDGSRSSTEDGGIHMGSATVVPEASLQMRFRLNELSSSFTAEAIAISKTLEIAQSNKGMAISQYLLIFIKCFDKIEIRTFVGISFC